MSPGDLPLGEHDFWKRLRGCIRQWEKEADTNSRWRKYVVMAPDFFQLLIKLTLDKNIPTKYKAETAVVLAYFILPNDIIPDNIPLVGWLDDVALAAYLLKSLLDDPDTAEIAKGYWEGKEELSDVVSNILEMANDMLGSTLFEKLVDWFKSKTE